MSLFLIIYQFNEASSKLGIGLVDIFLPDIADECMTYEHNCALQFNNENL